MLFKSDSLTVDDYYKFQALKIIDIPEWEAISLYEITDYVSSNGFYDIVKILKDNNNKYYQKKEDKIYLYLDCNMDRKYKIRGIQNGKDTAKIIAEFHNSVEGFSKEGIKVNVMWGKKIAKLKKMTACLERYCDYLIDKEKHNEFEKATEIYVDDFLYRAKSIIRILTSEGSIRRLEESMEKREICLNNISSNTFMVSNGRVIIQDIYHMGYNMVEEDIALLIRKVIESNNEKTSFDEIIKSYKTVRRLNSDSIDIIKALESYPVDSVKVIQQYMEDKCCSDDLIRKFKKYAKKETKTNILEV